MQEDNIEEANNDSVVIAPVIAGVEPKLWQRIAFWSIFPAIVYIPFWFAFGRESFGAGGWMGLFTIMVGLVVIFPYQLVVMALALMAKKQYLSRWASGLIYLYYTLQITLQISLVDGGDTTQSVGSVLTFKGVPDLANNVIYGMSLTTGLVVMVALIVIMIMDVTRSRRVKLI